MKAVIVKIEGLYASALCKNGTFVRIKNKNYSVGQVIMLKKQSVMVKSALAASAAVAVLALSVGVWAYVTPYAYVSMDVNPSVEYTLNRFDRVLTVKAVNDDGQEILKEVKLENLKNKTIDEAIAKTVAEINAHDYFKDGGAIVIATSAKDIKKAEALASRLKEEADRTTEEQGQEVEVEATSVGRERVEQARELGVTPGKLNLVEKLRDSMDPDAEFDLQEWLQKPVREIMKATNANLKAAKGQPDANVQNENEEEQAERLDGKKEKAASEAERKQEKAENKQIREEAKAKRKEAKAEAKVEQKQEQAEFKAENKQAREESKAQRKQEKEQSKAESKQAQEESRAEGKQEKAESNAESKQEKAQAKVADKTDKGQKASKRKG